MNMDEVRRMHQEKEHLMRHEGKHPSNYSREEKLHSLQDSNSSHLAGSVFDEARKENSRMPELHNKSPENMPSIKDKYDSQTNVEIL